jgi:hypothetical protein
MLPANYNLPDAYRGDSYGPLLFSFSDASGNPILLDGSQARAQVRYPNKRWSVREWSTNNNSIQISGNQLIMNRMDGNNMNMEAGVYHYDLEVTTSGERRTYISGLFNVFDDVTR